MTDMPCPVDPCDAFRRALHDAEISVTFASIGLQVVGRHLAEGTDPGAERELLFRDIQATVARLSDNVRTLTALSGAVFGRQDRLIGYE